MDNSTILILVVAAVVIVAVAVAVWLYLQKQRTRRLRSRFGPEYNRTVRTEGSNKQAERVLEEREKRIEQLEVKPLSDRERERFAQAWEQEQAHFVDQPREALNNADRLLTEVMKARGYPMGDFDQRAADVSVDHPIVVENYRIAHNIAVRDRKEPVSTETLREAMIHYRALFADLLHDGGMRPIRDVVVPGQNTARAREAGR
jgi:FtsZ-interacting cell division protein ZipA